MNLKKISKWFFTAIGVVVIAQALTGCGSAPEKDHIIKVGATSSPHAEILEQVKDDLKDEGYVLEIVEFNDYVVPNQALASGEIDANYFQHFPYLVDYNKNNNTQLKSAGGIHFEPLSLFAGKSRDYKNIQDGATIAVPSDATNEARALLFLQDEDIITLKEDVGLEATKKDIKDNPHNVEIIEAEAASLPRKLEDVDFAVINGNYALSANLSKKDLLATEDTQGEVSKRYANIIAVRAEDIDSDKIHALMKVLQSQKVKDYVDANYQGQVVTVF